MKKVPTIVLSVSYKGVKFIDATNKVRLSSKTARVLMGGRLSPSRLTEFILPLVITGDATFLLQLINGGDDNARASWETSFIAAHQSTKS